MAEASADKKVATNKWAERLRGRGRMAVAAIGGVFMIGFLGISRPLSQRIDGANERLTKANSRAQLADDVSDLRHQAALYQKKLPRGVDPNDWTNYLLAGIRTQPVRLVRLDPKETLSLGPCKVMAWQVEIEGSFEPLSRVVQWLENGERLVRIDRLTLHCPHGGTIGMAMVVKGLALDVPLEKLKAEKEKAEKAEKAQRASAAKQSQEKAIPDAIREPMPQVPDTLPLGVTLPDPAKATHSDAVKNAIEEAQRP